MAGRAARAAENSRLRTKIGAKVQIAVTKPSSQDKTRQPYPGKFGSVPKYLRKYELS